MPSPLCRIRKRGATKPREDLPEGPCLIAQLWQPTSGDAIAAQKSAKEKGDSRSCQENARITFQAASSSPVAGTLMTN